LKSLRYDARSEKHQTLGKKLEHFLSLKFPKRAVNICKHCGLNVSSVLPSTNLVSLTYLAALSPAHGLNLLMAKINLYYIQQFTLYLTENRLCLQYKNHTINIAVPSKNYTRYKNKFCGKIVITIC